MYKVIFIVLMVLIFQNVVFGQQSEIMIDGQKKYTTKESVGTSDKWLAKDKLQHFLLSGFLTAYSYGFLRETVDSPESRALAISGVGVTGLGITKEIYDLKSKKGHPSFKDILANLLGVGTALFFIKVL